MEKREIVSVTTHIVRLKVFRLKAKVIRRAIVPHVVEEIAASRSNYGFTIRLIPVFP